MEVKVKKRVAFHTLGCKVNIYETEALRRVFENDGYSVVDFNEEADVYVINTCSVTNIADRKSRQMIHRARKLNPDAVVIATGCFSEGLKEMGAIAAAHELGIEKVIFNEEKAKIVEEATKLTSKFAGVHTRADIKIQDGCNQFCSYCIIPYRRGKVTCRPIESIVEEVKNLAEHGHKEVVLTGIHITLYGRDELIKLMKAVAAIDGIERVRLGSLEPRIIDDVFLSGCKEIKEFCPHFHLSLQSGCDKTLKAMNRHYTTQEYRERVALIRQYYEHPAITTDVIAGFPGETEEDFAESLRFCDEMKFFEMHIFPYSRRKGTKADKMPDQLTQAEKEIRVDRMEEINAKNTEEFIRYYDGKEIELLTESVSFENGVRFVTGCTPEYVKLKVPTDEIGPNELIATTVSFS